MTLCEAFEPWLPELITIEKKKLDGEPGYSGIGFENLVVPTDCTRVSARMSTLKVLFDQRYAYRMLNAETLERWQVRLQNTFDRIVHTYERAYELYAKYQTDMLNDMLGGEIITRDLTSGGSQVNTPDYATNATDDYADSRSRGKIDETITTVRTGDDLVDSINRGFQNWVDIDQALIQEFENNFLNIFWY